MRRRLIVSVGGGMVGMLAGLPITQLLGVELPFALIGSTVIGLVLGYFVSLMCDVFFGDVGGTTIGETENQSQ